MAREGIQHPVAPPRRAPRQASSRRWRISLDPRGQSLVEFAISFPVIMMMILFGIDFGRVFLGWVQLSAAVREAANFAALNPAAWTAPINVAAQTEYARLITAESNAINCTLPATVPDPTFPNGTDVGSPTVVAITCQFSLITPLIGNILGSPIPVSAAASFPIRSGLLIDGTGFSGNGLPSFSSGPGGATTDPGGGGPGTSTDPGGGGPGSSTGPTPIPTPSGIPTPVPTCQVPNFFNTNTSQATRTWTDRGFSANNLSFNPLVPPNYKIKTQSITKDTWVVCTSTMTVAP
jgi:Flp pilus assembly protein TadG